MEVTTKLYLGDCKEVIKKIPDNSIDLIFTSPPYADQRKSTYGGIYPNKYVGWFLPLAKELFRVLKPSGHSNQTTGVWAIFSNLFAQHTNTNVAKRIFATIPNSNCIEA